ncbi:phosphoribosylanthranilate isomerase [Roseovarius sp. SYSU LYC5161]|uniref:phosphoribosylanthranilate isomerase n=1 Tax=Roseovarius halophilus (ex Wu et al. 2025) TaxID=3376060 RepID=UPI00399AB21B
MTSGVKVKICGLTEPADIPAAILAGASYLGFVFFPRSPRHLVLEDAAFMLSAVPEGITKVVLTVDADDAMLDALTDAVPVDMLQLHGSESPERVAAVRSRYAVPVMKALGVAGPEDLPQIDTYSDVVDQLLVDAKPPEGADRPGGNALAFDWSLIAARRWRVPWMLAGGLTPDNVAAAIARTGARQVDVSSGVESAPGVKDSALMQAFVSAVRT